MSPEVIVASAVKAIKEAEAAIAEAEEAEREDVEVERTVVELKAFPKKLKNELELISKENYKLYGFRTQAQIRMIN